jgi:cytochrome c oxidase subunit 2
LFEDFRCDSCHRGGGAQRGPPLEGLFGRTVTLADGASVLVDENYLRESILRPQSKVVAGFQPIMPTFEGQIGEEGLMQLVAYIKSLGPQGAGKQ